MKHSLPWKWKYSVPIAALTLSLVLPALLAAALITERTGSDASVLSQVDSELLVGLIDAPVDLFNSPEVLWQGKTDTTRLTAPELLPFDGQTALEGSRSLLIEEASYRTSYGASLLYSFPDPLPDYTAHPTCTLSVFLPSEGSYSLTLTLRSSFIDAEQSHHRLTYEKTVRVSGYGWQTVLFDVSAFQGRSSVRELEISVKSDEAVYGQPFSVALDAVGFCSSPAPLQALRFLSDAYQPEDCTIRCEERMTVSATGSGASFSATSLPALTLGEDTALCVSLINHGGFRTLCDAECGVYARRLEKRAQQVGAERVDGADAGKFGKFGLLAESGILARQCAHALDQAHAHIGGGGAGKGDDQHFADVGTLLKQRRHALDQYGGFSRACGGRQQQVVAAGTDGFLLVACPFHIFFPPCGGNG